MSLGDLFVHLLLVQYLLATTAYLWEQSWWKALPLFAP